MNASFTPKALEDLRWWIRNDRKIADQILKLFETEMRSVNNSRLESLS